MSIEEAIKILDYKINMYGEDVFIGDLDKTNIEAIKKVLKEIERLNNIIIEINNAFEDKNIHNNMELVRKIKNIVKGVDKK